VVCAVPWARHQARFTTAFEDQTAWLAVNCSKTAVAQLMRIAWRTVGGICERVAAEAQREVDLLAGLHRIGIDEISHRTGQRYLTVVVDHDRGRLVWAAAGRDRKTVEAFLDALGEECCKQVTLVYLLKEQLRQIYRLPADAAIRLLDGWLKWARRSRLTPFIKLARTITDQRAGIVVAIQHDLSNARVEAINTQIRLITRRAYGFHTPDARIALAVLSLADLCPPLPR
jgi:transposase